MCRECRQEPCHPSCPNAEPQKCVCDRCGRTLGRHIYIEDEYICDDCLFDMNGEDLAERLGIMETI